MPGDAHIHLNALQNPTPIATCSANIFCVSCSPAGWQRTAKLIAGVPTARAGLGLHPWWVPSSKVQDEDAVERFEDSLNSFLEHAPNTHFIGEIGLDFYGENKENSQQQVSVFQQICQALVSGGHVISLHTRGADKETLELLEDSGALRGNRCILHAFNGPSSAMTQALRAGCYFSVGERELKTKRWREYAKQLPLDRLLLESDAPHAALSPFTDATYETSVADWQGSLIAAAKVLNDIREEETTGALEDNLARLLA